MTGGYDSWWRVGTAQASENPAVVEAARKMNKEAEAARVTGLFLNPIEHRPKGQSICRLSHA